MSSNTKMHNGNVKHRNQLGTYFRKLRLNRGLTLRKFCLKYDLYPGNISNLERGVSTLGSAIKVFELNKCYGGCNTVALFYAYNDNKDVLQVKFKQDFRVVR